MPALPDYVSHYSSQVTNRSLEELKNFLQWCNELLGHEPAIVGGWAVYAFVPGHLGSRDIDVVFPSNEIVHRVMTQYYYLNGFKAEPGLEKTFYKDFVVEGKKERLIYDVTSFERINRLKEDPKIVMPWNLLASYRQRQILDGHALWTPSLELLLAYKVKALRDRSHDLRQRGLLLSRLDRFRLESKAWKDEQDIKALLNLKQTNEGKLDEILTQTGFKAYYQKTMRELTGLKDGLKKGLKPGGLRKGPRDGL